MKYLLVIGRFLFAYIFLSASFGHFSQQTIAYAQAQGVPLASIAVPFSGILALIGSLSIILGYQAKWGAFLIVLFLIPVTLMMHNFWAIENPEAAALQKIMFMKNVSMLGAAFMLTYFGSGPCSLDNLKKKK